MTTSRSVSEPAHESEGIDLRLIRLAESVWPRAGFDHDRVEDFARLFRDQGADALPAIVVVADGAGQYLVCDGHHRVSALHQIEASEAWAIVEEPGEDQTPEQFAFEKGVVSAATSAKPLTRAERNRAVERYLETHPEWADRLIASVCGVSHQTVGRRRARRFNGPPPESKASGHAAEGPDDAGGLQAARRLFAALEKFWASEPESTAAGEDAHGEQLARVLQRALGDAALDRAREYQAVFVAAVEALCREAT